MTTARLSSKSSREISSCRCSMLSEYGSIGLSACRDVETTVGTGSTQKAAKDTKTNYELGFRDGSWPRHFASRTPRGCNRNRNTARTDHRANRSAAKTSSGTAEKQRGANFGRPRSLPISLRPSWPSVQIFFVLFFCLDHGDSAFICCMAQTRFAGGRARILPQPDRLIWTYAPRRSKGRT